jgi:hypothetical protein
MKWKLSATIYIYSWPTSRIGPCGKPAGLRPLLLELIEDCIISQYKNIVLWNWFIRMLRTPGTRLRSHQKNCWQFGALVHLSCPDLGCHYKMSHGVASEKYCKHRFYLVENKVEDALIVYCNSSDLF